MPPVISIQRAQAQREKEVSNALASVRMEGLEPSDEAKDIFQRFQRYVNGELTLKEMGRAADQLADGE